MQWGPTSGYIYNKVRIVEALFADYKLLEINKKLGNGCRSKERRDSLVLQRGDQEII